MGIFVIKLLNDQEMLVRMTHFYILQYFMVVTSCKSARTCSFVLVSHRMQKCLSRSCMCYSISYISIHHRQV